MFLAFAACTSTKPESVPDDTATTHDSDPPPEAYQPRGTFSFLDYVTSEELFGAAVTVGDQSGTTHADGAITFALPPVAPYELVATLGGYPAYHQFGTTSREDFVYATTWPSESVVSDVYSAAAVPPAGGTVTVSVVTSDDEGFTPLAGVEVELDLPHLAAIRLGEAGFEWGTLTGEDGLVTFLAVDAGRSTPTVKTEASCRVFPGWEPYQEIEAFDGAFSTTTFVCDG